MAAGATYEPIATTTLGAGANTVTFSSISQSYTDLVCVVSNLKVTADTDSIGYYFNGSTASNYSYTYLDRGPGSSRGSNQGGTGNYLSWAATSSTIPGVLISNIMNYSNTTTYKTSVSRIGGRTVEGWVNLWRSTAAISSITFFCQGSNNYLTGTTFTIYGIAAA
jgi:hypothetical protein